MTVISTSGTIVRVSELQPGQRLPQVFTITTTSPATTGATDLNISAAPGTVPVGTKLTFSGTNFITTVRNQAENGYILLGVQPLLGAIPSGATAGFYNLHEFIGGEGVDISAQDSVINIRNFKSGQWSESSKVMVGASMDLEGQLHKEDKALANVIRPAAYSIGKEIYCEVVRSNGDIYKGAFLVSGYSEPGALDNVVRVRFTLSSQGAISIPATLP